MSYQRTNSNKVLSDIVTMGASGMEFIDHLIIKTRIMTIKITKENAGGLATVDSITRRVYGQLLVDKTYIAKSIVAK